MIEKQSSNSKGGARLGAGRKKGEPNRRTIETQAKAQEGGIMPLDYMLSVMRNEFEEPKARLAAAQASAPYVHARLSNVEVSGADGGPIDHSLTVKFVGV